MSAGTGRAGWRRRKIPPSRSTPKPPCSASAPARDNPAGVRRDKLALASGPAIPKTHTSKVRARYRWPGGQGAPYRAGMRQHASATGTTGAAGYQLCAPELRHTRSAYQCGRAIIDNVRYTARHPRESEASGPVRLRASNQAWLVHSLTGLSLRADYQARRESSGNPGTSPTSGQQPRVTNGALRTLTPPIQLPALTAKAVTLSGPCRSRR